MGQARTGWATMSLMAVLMLVVVSNSEPAPQETAAPTAAPTDEGTPDDASEAGEGLEVVTSVFALAAVAGDIAPGADVELLGARGQDPHDLELSPRDRAAIEDADVFMYMGDISFQPQVEAAAASVTGEAIAVADIVGEADLHDFDHDDHAHDDDHGDVDPHVWLSPALMRDVATAMADAFARLDPDQAERYERRAAQLGDDLLATERQIDDRLADCRHSTALVGHEAWAYLFEPRGIEQEGIAGAGGHGEASPQRLGELADLIEEHDIPGVFAEPVEGRENAEALAAEADAELFEVDPLETPTDVDAWTERGYLALLMDQVDTFAEGLRCQT